MAGLTATAEPVAAVHDVALYDLDGVVYVAYQPVPHAAESLASALQLYGMRAGFVTNNAARPAGEVAQTLRSMGIAAQDADVVTSAQAAARVLDERLEPGARVLAVGGPGVAWALDERGFTAVFSADDDPAAVVTGYGPQVGWPELAEASLAIGRGVLWVATNTDATIPSPRGRVLGNGALVAALQFATKVEPVVAGKPAPPLMLESVERTHADRPLFVGDRLDTDIEGATRSGLASMLVLTGVSDWWDLIDAPVELRPTYLGADLRALLEPAPPTTIEQTGDRWVASCGDAEVMLQVSARGSAVEASVAGPAQWLPEGATGIDCFTSSGLDLVRCFVALGWSLADGEAVAVGKAVVTSR